MSGTILQCSAGHWLRPVLAWSCLAVAMAVSLSRTQAEEGTDAARRIAEAEVPAPIVARTETALASQAGITLRVTSFDFNAADMAAYGDAEAEPLSRDR